MKNSNVINFAAKNEKSLGAGVGLRDKHYPIFLRGAAQPARWIEVNSEKYLPLEGGKFDSHLQILSFVREQMPVILHGTSMSLGTVGGDNSEYLKKLKELIAIIEPEHVSDHLCWSGTNGGHLFDLLPLPFNQESIDVVVPRILAAQDFLGRRILVENLSSYFESASSEMSEWEFVSTVLKQADCQLLLDINNVYVSCTNHGWDPKEYLAGIPHERVLQIHLAGHTNHHGLLIDTHGAAVSDPVWDLYRWYIEQNGQVSTMVEWDNDIPQWDVMAGELSKIESILSVNSPAVKKCA